MPKPGDDILLSATLLVIYGTTPTTHSCTVQVLDKDGANVFGPVAMTNVTDTVYTYKWETLEAMDEGPYQILYQGTLDGIVAPPVSEIIYIENMGLAPEDLTAILDAIAVVDANVDILVEQASWVNRADLFQYDSQGRTEIVTRYLSDTDPITSPQQILEYNFSYNADNSLSNVSVEDITP